MLNYDLLIGLKAVITEGSFDAAAKSLNITPSALSQRVKLLEERLEALLIVRGKPCTATDYGYALLKHTEQIEFLEKNLFNAMARKTGAGSSSSLTLRMAVNEDSLATWFPAAIAKINLSGNFLFDIVVDDQEQTINLLRRGDVVAAITSTRESIQGFKNTFIGSLRYTAVASPEFMKRHFPGGVVNKDTIKHAPSLFFNRKDTLPTIWVKQVFEKNIKVPKNWMPSFDGYINSCRNGVGWGLHPLSVIKDEIASGKLVELVENSYVDIPLYWQFSASYGRTMAKISDLVIATGRELLEQK